MTPHILAFEEAPGFGGAFVDLKHIAIELMRRDVRVSIAHAWRGPQWAGLASMGVRCLHHGRWDLAERAAIHPSGQALPRWAKMGLYGLDVCANQAPLALKYAAWAKRHRVTHIFLNNALTQNLPGALVARLLGLPLYVYYQGNVRRDRLQQALLGTVTRTFAVSRWTAEENARQGVPIDGVQTLYPGIERPDSPEALAPIPPGSQDGRIRVGMVGMITPWKGQLEFLDAFGQAAQQDARLQGLLFGGTVPGHEAYAQRVRARIDALGLRDRVRLIADRKDPARIYPEVDFTVHSSIDPEPFGRVIIEAMYFGRPPIVAGDGGTTEIVTDGQTGYVASPREPAKVAARILQLGRDARARQAMGARARQEVLSRFTYPRVLRPLLDALGLAV